ncbi:hypothetical protein LMG28138_03277 [Pararobbsia alpina]|uniref:Uncharacterized protein n=1 Tax=Pararobbsia alpina TaxID=621374 RepID=A0A6S7B8X3_9BURK|nr:hypothetical protein LMG28138_03277 [Pararobbsia alpina]
MKPGSDIAWDCAISVTDWLPVPSCSSTARRVGSERAAKTASSA